MKNSTMISHETFVKGYRAGEYLVYIDKYKAGDFVMSKVADKNNKRAHIFWSWTGIVLTIPLPIILVFSSWVYSIASFILGLLVVSSSRKSAEQFVMENMINDKYFWEYVLMYKGARIVDKKGKEITYA